MPSNTTLALYGLGGALGLLVAGWSVQASFWYGYQRANPAIGTVSTAAGSEAVTALLFVVGIAVAFTAFARGLAHALDPDQ